MPPSIALIPWTVSTRNSNKDKHPGIPDKPKPRRKTADVSKARQQAAEAEKQQEEECLEAANEVALIEDKLQDEDRRREAERLTDIGEPQQEIRSPVIEKGRILNNKNGRAYTKSKSIIARGSDSEDLLDTIPSKVNDKIKNTERNKRPHDNSEDEGEYDNDKDDLEGNVDGEASEGDSHRKKRKKTMTRKDIDKLRKTTAVPGTVNPKQQIIDLDETSQGGKNGKKKTSSKDTLSGLIPGWDKQKKQGQSIIADNGEESEDDTLAQYGGLVADDETDEVEARATKKMTVKKAGDDNVIMIKPNPLAPKKLVEVRQGAKHWSLKHLPNEAQDTWESEVSARLRSKGGSSTDPWNFPKMSEIQEIINKVYGEGKYKVVEDGPFYGLAQVRVQNWRRIFFEAAKKAVATLIAENANVLKTEKTIAGYIATYLSKTTDGETCVYQWREVDPETERKKEKALMPLIIKTLGLAHIAKLPEVLCDFTAERPVGALVLATQAACISHALEQWQTGKLVPGNKEFSAENYANKEDFVPVVDARQKRKTMKKVITHRTTLFFDAMEDFTPERWDKIIDGAREFVPKKSVKKKKRETTLPDDIIIIEDESCKRARFVINDYDSEGDVE